MYLLSDFGKLLKSKFLQVSFLLAMYGLII